MRPRKFDRARVAEIVREAMEAGLPVAATVAEVLDITPSQASYYVRKAHRDGLFGEEGHRPATARIFRGTPSERSWLVCAECLDRWPCASAGPLPQE